MEQLIKGFVNFFVALYYLKSKGSIGNMAKKAMQYLEITIPDFNTEESQNVFHQILLGIHPFLAEETATDYREVMPDEVKLSIYQEFIKERTWSGKIWEAILFLQQYIIRNPQWQPQTPEFWGDLRYWISDAAENEDSILLRKEIIHDSEVEKKIADFRSYFEMIGSVVSSPDKDSGALRQGIGIVCNEGQGFILEQTIAVLQNEFLPRQYRIDFAMDIWGRLTQLAKDLGEMPDKKWAITMLQEAADYVQKYAAEKLGLQEQKV